MDSFKVLQKMQSSKKKRDLLNLFSQFSFSDMHLDKLVSMQPNSQPTVPFTARFECAREWRHCHKMHAKLAS